MRAIDRRRGQTDRRAQDDRGGERIFAARAGRGPGRDLGRVGEEIRGKYGKDGKNGTDGKEQFGGLSVCSVFSVLSPYPAFTIVEESNRSQSHARPARHLHPNTS